jgi:hypothetical protein
LINLAMKFQLMPIAPAGAVADRSGF